MRTRSQAAAAVLTLTSLPDDAFHQVIMALCIPDTWGPPLFEAVKELAYLSKGVLQQLHRLRPLVGVTSLAVVQRPAHGPWCVTLIYGGELTEEVVEQARQGRVRSIDVNQPPANSVEQQAWLARRMVPDLLGEGCSLLELFMGFYFVNGTWAATFGEAAVCSAVLHTLHLQNVGLRGPLPELRLPALEELLLDNNELTGGLEPLLGCTALWDLDLSCNKLSGTLEPLRSCPMLEELNLYNNQLTGSLEPLRGCTELSELSLAANLLTGSLEPLRSCTMLQKLYLFGNTWSGGLEPLRGCTALLELDLDNTQLTGGLEPLQGCTMLIFLALSNNNLTGGLDALRACTALECLLLSNNQHLTGALEALWGCTALKQLQLGNTQLVPSDEDKAHFQEQCEAMLRGSYGLFWGLPS